MFQHFWIFLHFWSAGNFPAFLECRKFSCISGVPEIFLHIWSAGNFPAFLECRKFSSISGSFIELFLSASVHLYIYQSLLQYTCSYTFQFFYLHEHFCRTHVPTLFIFLYLHEHFCRMHVPTLSIYMSSFVGRMFLHM